MKLARTVVGRKQFKQFKQQFLEHVYDVATSSIGLLLNQRLERAKTVLDISLSDTSSLMVTPQTINAKHTQPLPQS